jgi:hypothetical protein
VPRFNPVRCVTRFRWHFHFHCHWHFLLLLRLLLAPTVSVSLVFVFILAVLLGIREASSSAKRTIVVIHATAFIFTLVNIFLRATPVTVGVPLSVFVAPARLIIVPEKASFYIERMRFELGRG